MKKIFTIIMLAALSLMAVAQQKKVAMYVTGEQSGISKVLGDQLVTAFAKSGKYTAVERTTSFLAELNKEHGYQRSGAVSDKDIARLGEQFEVQFVCVADITDAFGDKYVSARLIDVVTAEIVNAHNVSGEMNSMNACVSMANEIATNLSKGSFAEQEREKEMAEQKKKEAEQLRAQQEQQQKQAVIQRNFDIGYVKLGTFYVTKTLTSTRDWDYAKNQPLRCGIGGWDDWRFPTEAEVKWIRYCFDAGNTTFSDELKYIFVDLYDNKRQWKDYTQECIWAKNGVIVMGTFNNYCRNDTRVILVRGYK